MTFKCKNGSLVNSTKLTLYENDFYDISIEMNPKIKEQTVTIQYLLLYLSIALNAYLILMIVAMFFKKKRGENNSRYKGEKMKCGREECNNELSDFEFIRLKRRQNGEEIVLGDFCSIECAEQYIENHEDIGRYRFKEVSRCPAYYYCLKNGNLRGGCEEEHSIEEENVHGFLIPGIRPPPICEPAEAGIILATSRFDENSTKISKNMQKLTWAILGFTIINLILISIQIYLALTT